MKFKELDEVVASLEELVDDKLITLSENGLKVTQEGIPFIRNICMAFDLKMIRNKPETRLFSMTI
ncbi:coproporphyrinogen III oxidase [compost metagenome]